MENRSSSEGSLASSAADDTEGKSNEVLLEELAGDYSRFLNFDVSKEQGKFSESIETMLTKLEEFCGLVDMIRSDTTLCLSKTMPEIQSKWQEMQDMFDRIDHLEAFVSVVKKDVMAMEESVSKAEAELSSGTLIKKLSSLVSSKKSSSSSRPSQKPHFTPPHIFHTERYLITSTSGDSASAAPVSADCSASAAATSESAVMESAGEGSDIAVEAT